MNLFLIPGLVLGLSAQLVFYSLIVLNHISAAWIIVLHLLCFEGLFLYFKKHPIKIPGNITVLTMLLIVTGAGATILALNAPFGDWDAWSYWNYQADFIYKAGDQWLRVFQFQTQAHHPWFLPCMVVAGWSFSGNENNFVPMAIAIVFTLSCLGLLVSALRTYLSSFWSLLAGLFLVSLPVYLMRGVSQYADVLLAYYMLAAVVLILELLKAPSKNTAVLTGIFLGFMAGSKDNGIVAALLLFVLLIVHLRRRGLKGMIRPLSWGIVVIFVSVLLMKSFDAINVDNHAYDFSLSGLFSYERWIILVKFLGAAFADPWWGYLWPLATLSILLFRKKWKEEEGIKLILRFLLFYIIIYFFIFESFNDLKWLLSVSFYRLLYLVTPTVVFVTFYALGTKESRTDA